MATVASIAVNFRSDLGVIANDLTNVRKTFSKNISQIKSLAAGAFATFVSVSAIKETISMTAALNDMAQKTGFAAEGIQKLRIAAGQNTVNAETLDGALTKFNTTLGQARDGSAQAAKALAKFGITQKDIATLSNEEILNKVADGMARIEDSGLRASRAAVLFGKDAGPGMAVFLAQGSGSLSEFNARLQDAGAIMDNDLVARVGGFADKMGTLGSTVQMAFGNGLFSTLASEIDLTDDTLISAAKSANSFGKFIGSLGAQILELGKFIFDGAIKPIWDLIGGFDALKLAADIVINSIKLSFSSLGVVLNSTLLAMAKGLDGFDDFVTNTKKSLGLDAERSSFTKDFLEGQTLAYEDAVKKFDDAAKSLDASGQKIISFYKAPDRDAFMKSLEKGSTTIKDTTDKLNIFGKAGEDAGDKAARGLIKTKNAADNLKKSTESAKESQNSLFSSLIGNIGDTNFSFKSLGETILNSLTSRVQNQGFGGFGSFFNDIGGIFSDIFGGFRADGGGVAAGKAYVVGERGPELFMPGQSGSIVPNGALMSGGGGTSVNVNIINQAGVDVQARPSSNGRDIEIMIRNSMRSMIAGGGVDDVMRNRFGARPVPTGR